MGGKPRPVPHWLYKETAQERDKLRKALEDIVDMGFVSVVFGSHEGAVKHSDRMQDIAHDALGLCRRCNSPDHKTGKCKP